MSEGKTDSHLDWHWICRADLEIPAAGTGLGTGGSRCMYEYV